MKRLLLFFAVLVGFSSVASAQFAYNERQLYIDVGDSVDSDQSRIYVVESINGEIKVFWTKINSIKWYMKNKSMTIREIWTPGTALSGATYAGRGYCKYDANLSTNKYQTYTFKQQENCHVSVSHDKKVMLWWHDDGASPTYNRLLDPSELEPKAANLDFLYE